MKIKTNPEFETFEDGVCAIKYIDPDAGERPITQYARLPFGFRTMGDKRFYAAMAANTETTDVIRVPMRRDIKSNAWAEINGGNDRYDIARINHITLTNPPVTELTLKKV